MKYKHKKVEKSEEEYFVYRPKHKKNIQKNAIKKPNKNKLFDKLSELRFR